MSTSDPTPGETPSRPYHHGDLRRALIEAAHAMVEESGPETLSLRNAARRIGVSHNAPYRHFPSRTELLAAVAADGFRALRDAVEQEQGLAAGIRAYIGFARAHPGLFRLMFGETLQKSADPALWAASEHAYDGLRRCVHEVAPGADRATVAVAWAQLHGLALLTITGQLASDLVDNRAVDILVDRAAAILKAGLPLATSK